MTNPVWTLDDEVVADVGDAFDAVIVDLEEDARSEEPRPAEFLPVGRQQDMFGEAESA